ATENGRVLDATERGAGGLEAPAPAARAELADGDGARAKRGTDAACFVPALLVEVALGRTVVGAHAGRIEDAGRRGVTDHHDLAAALEQRPQRVVGGGRRGAGKQQREREDGGTHRLDLTRNSPSSCESTRENSGEEVPAGRVS